MFLSNVQRTGSGFVYYTKIQFYFEIEQKFAHLLLKTRSWSLCFRNATLSLFPPLTTEYSSGKAGYCKLFLHQKKKQIPNREFHCLLWSLPNVGENGLVHFCQINFQLQRSSRERTLSIGQPRSKVIHTEYCLPRLTPVSVLRSRHIFKLSMHFLIKF